MLFRSENGNVRIPPSKHMTSQQSEFKKHLLSGEIVQQVMQPGPLPQSLKMNPIVVKKEDVKKQGEAGK